MNDTDYMMEALKEAKKAYEENEVPVGAIVVMNDISIATSAGFTPLILFAWPIDVGLISFSFSFASLARLWISS